MQDARLQVLLIEAVLELGETMAERPDSVTERLLGLVERLSTGKPTSASICGNGGLDEGRLERADNG
jgi:hypothetical protein